MNDQKFECELSDEQITEQIKTFAAMAIVLQTDSDIRLEYGNPNDRPGSFLSFIRVSHIPTAGGQQYRACSIHMGTESGGYYTTDIQELAREIEKRIRHAHRLHDNPKIRKLLAKTRAVRPKLGWYFSTLRTTTSRLLWRVC